MCAGLAASGFNVTLIVADGCGDDEVSSVKIVDVGKAKGRFERFFITPWRIYSVAMGMKPHLVQLHDPEMLLTTAAFRLWGVGVVFDSHEDYPRSIAGRSWIPAPFRRLIGGIYELFERFISLFLSGIITASQFVADRFGKFHSHVSPIRNFPMMSEFTQNDPFGPKKDQICYIGALSQDRGLFEMIEAAELAGVKLVLAGKWENSATEVKAKAMSGWRNVDYLGVIDRPTVAKVTSESKLGLIVMHPTENYKTTITIKLIEYMAAGIPSVASNFEQWDWLVHPSSQDGAPVALTVDPQDAKSIAAAITKLLNDDKLRQELGARGQAAAKSEFLWSDELQKLIEFYKAI